MLQAGVPEYRWNACLSSPVTSHHPGTQTLNFHCLWQESSREKEKEREEEGRGEESLQRSLCRVFISHSLNMEGPLWGLEQKRWNGVSADDTSRLLA